MKMVDEDEVQIREFKMLTMHATCIAMYELDSFSPTAI